MLNLKLYFNWSLKLPQESQTLEFTEDSIVMRLKVTSDDLNDSAVSCGAKKTVQGVDIVVETGSGPCLEGYVLNISEISPLLKIILLHLIFLQKLWTSFPLTGFSLNLSHNLSFEKAFYDLMNVPSNTRTKFSHFLVSGIYFDWAKRFLKISFRRLKVFSETIFKRGS